LGDCQRGRNGADKRRADAAPGEPHRSAPVAAPFEHGAVGGLRDLCITWISVGPDRARRRGRREGMQIDPEKILRAASEPRFDDPLKPYILDRLARQGVVDADKGHAWLAAAHAEIARKVSLDDRRAKAPRLGPRRHGARLSLTDLSGAG